MSAPFEPGALVIVYLHTPREKIWGVLQEMSAAGVSLRGIDVASFDDWLRGLAPGGEEGIVPSLVFYPLLRVEKILLDDPDDPLGLDGQCRARTKRGGRELLEG
jgi:hypothetical protein